jgi:hypothetical protein
VIAIPRRFNTNADLLLAYFSAEREGYLKDAAHGVFLLLWEVLSVRGDVTQSAIQPE